MTDRKTIAVKRTVRAVIFVIVLAALLHGIYYLVRPASAVRMSRTRSYESARVFDEKPDSLDVIFLGHSGVYSSVSPMELYKEYGFTSYVCAQPLQLPWESSRWLESLVRVQSPRLVVFEVDHLFYDKNSTVAANSVEYFINRTFPVFRSHANWKKWFSRGKKRERSFAKGFYYNTTVNPYRGGKKLTPTDKVYKIGKKHMDALERVYALCKENNIELMLLEVPSVVVWDYSRHNAVVKYAEKRGLEFIDLNLRLDELGFDWNTDTRDKGDHLNYSGALKVSGYVGRHIKKTYGLEDRRNDPAYESWKEDLARYEQMTGG